jgi:type I restriction enzyme S subunit
MAASNSPAEQLITENIGVWTSAIKKRGSQGRGSSKKIELHGIKKLRELILELAVHGLLVPQDPSDEPASVLLEKIAAEKEQLLSKGKIKKQKQLLDIHNDHFQNIPQSWSVSRLGSLFHIVYGKGLSSKELLDEGYDVFGANGIIGKYSKFLYEEPQLLISCRGAYSGKPNLSPKRCYVTSNSLVLENTWKYINKRFFFYSLTVVDKTIIVTGSAQPQVTTTNLEPLIALVPPLKEQNRIVAKVDELMALCDQLEQQTESSLLAHQTLVETLLNTLLNADKNSFDQAWERIAQHFDLLFTTEHSIDQLKQTILQLAVMGKLAPQDPNDEPASVLLEKIAAEKEQLIKDKVIKKQKPLPPISEDEKPFELPNGWEWCRLDDLSLNSEAGWSPKCNGHTRENNKWGVLKVSAVSWGEYRPEENKELPDNLEPREQYEVHEGDFLISRANTSELVARAVVVPKNPPNKLMMSDKIIRFVFSDSVESEYINLVNASQVARDYYAAVAGGTSSSMRNVTREQIRNLVIALPPFKESKRIFNQYSSVLDLCNALKNNVRKSKNTQLHLADAMAERALN